MTRRKKRRAPPPSRAELDGIAIEQIESVARTVHRTVKAYDNPTLSFPQRSLSNVTYDPRVGYFELGDGISERTLTVNTAKSFAQMLLMMQFSRSMIRIDDYSTKRDAYYVSKNWGDARFVEQPESDTVIDDIEAMFARYGVTREQLRFVADAHGGSVAGQLVVIDRDPVTGADVFIDVTALGSGSWTIPTDVEGLRFETSAKFVLVIETQGVFERLNRARFWKQHNCIQIAMAGVPSRACRRFVRRLSDEMSLPVYVFTDCDPYGFANIYRTFKVGSGNAAHMNRFFSVPGASFLGVTPQDIIDYKLPTHPMGEVDFKRSRDALKNDPFFSSHRRWTKAFKQLVAGGQRAEQQAFAAHGLDYVYTTYLPQKLADVKAFLP